MIRLMMCLPKSRCSIIAIRGMPLIKGLAEQRRYILPLWRSWVVIPPFNEYGWLPDGVHDCTLDEAAERFGTFQNSDRRPFLWTRFTEFVAELKSCGMVKAIIADGSFVTAE